MPNKYAKGYKALNSPLSPSKPSDAPNPVLRLLALTTAILLALVAILSLFSGTRDAQACYSYADAIKQRLELVGLTLVTHYDRKAKTCIISNPDTGYMIPLSYREGR